MKAWRSASVMGSAICASHDAQIGAGWALVLRDWGRAVLKGAQRSPGAPDARHQRAERNAQCACRVLVGEALDRDQVESSPLLVRQAEKRRPDLLQPNAAVLRSRRNCLNRGGHLANAGCIGCFAPLAIDEAVVQEGEKPGAQVA